MRDLQSTELPIRVGYDIHCGVGTPPVVVCESGLVSSDTDPVHCVWIPFWRNERDGSESQLGAFISEEQAVLAAEQYRSEFADRPSPEILMNCIPVYETVAAWMDDR